jgi:hypothetical protein
MPVQEDDQLDLAVLIHDIRGPLTNLKGFCNEIEDSIIQLEKIINENQDTLPPQLYEKLSEVVNKDVTPCLSFSQTVIDQLNVRLDKFGKLSSKAQ